jgi:MarR family transcriptional regulator, 2-MHQ and catechol-resistance regulon repressor
MNELERQAAEMDRLLTALIKRYQFRDRNTICCDDVTVSQCYVLKELGDQGTLDMTALARRMCLKASTLTRVVDQLERKGLALRRRLQADRRVCCVELTAKGGALLKRMESMIRRSEKDVLSKLSKADREGLLHSLRILNDALDAREQARA